ESVNQPKWDSQWSTGFHKVPKESEHLKCPLNSLECSDHGVHFLHESGEHLDQQFIALPQLSDCTFQPSYATFEDCHFSTLPKTNCKFYFWICHGYLTLIHCTQ